MSATRHARFFAGRTLACLTAELLWAGPASAGCITQVVGTTAVHNCNGKVIISQTVGATTIHNIDGQFGISQAIGNLILHSGPLFEDSGQDDTAP